MEELAEYQQRVPTLELRAGDFLYVMEPTRRQGPRGGRYRFAGVRVESRVLEVGYGIGHRNPRFGVRTRAAAFSLPGNLEQLTTCIIRRREAEPAANNHEEATP